jgi:hypothetical protein
MLTCLCCAENLPVSEKKTCPLCGHSLMGNGWWGIDYHWKVRHELEMPYSVFWAGLCEPHRSAHPAPGDLAANSHPVLLAPETIKDAFSKAADRRSNQVENTLTRALIAAIAEELWRRDHWLDLQVFKDKVDDSGFDLVLGCNGAMRYIQVRFAALRGRAGRFPLRQDAALMPGGCAVVLVYQPGLPAIDHCLFFGGALGAAMPGIEDCPVSRFIGRSPLAGAALQPPYRDVPRRRFSAPLTMEETVGRLFPGIQERDSCVLALPPAQLARNDGETLARPGRTVPS